MGTAREAAQARWEQQGQVPACPSLAPDLRSSWPQSPQQAHGGRMHTSEGSVN